YDLLGNLIETYHEIKELLPYLNVVCCPGINAFPKHLLLGMVDEKTRQSTRHRFYFSPMVSRYDENIKQVRSLVLRLFYMLDQYAILSDSDVKITPSKSWQFKLGERAIPCYFLTKPSLVENWNYRETVNGLSGYQLGYHTDYLAAVGQVRAPLKFVNPGCDFYRIEGHLGKDFSTALRTISQIKKEFGLAFDVKAISIGTPLEAVDTNEYKSVFRDLQAILQAWRAEMNCIIANGSRFFGNYSYRVKATNSYASRIGSIARVAEAPVTEVNYGPGIQQMSAVPAPGEAYTVSEAVASAMDIISDSNISDLKDYTYKIIRDQGGIFRDEDPDAIEIYGTQPVNFVAGLYALDYILQNPGLINLEPDPIKKFKQSLRNLCDDIENSKISLSRFRISGKFGKFEQDNMYEFFVWELSKLCCYRKKIEWIEAEIEKRKAAIFEKLVLSHLTDTQCALQHMAGVPNGGTFFLVYAGGDDTNRNTVLFDFSIPYLCCSDCPPETVIYQEIPAHPMAPVTINGPAEVCQGSADNLYTTEEGMTGYTWNISAGGTITSGAGTKCITVKWNVNGDQYVSVNYSDQYGNTAKNPTIFPVTVNQLLEVSVTISPSSNPVCSGTQVRITAIPVNGGKTPLYKWLVNGIQAGTSNPVLDYTPKNGDLVKCILTSDQKCSSGNPATSAPVTMLVHPPFTAGSIGSNQVVCSNTKPAGLRGTPPAGGVAPYHYQWQLSTDNVNFLKIVKATSINYAPDALTKTTYFRMIQASSGGCGSLPTNVVKITVRALPVPAISGPVTSGRETKESVYTTQSGMDGYSWTVSEGNQILSGNGTDTVKVRWLVTGNQQVRVTYSNRYGCKPASPTVLFVKVD
ncbi:MAG: hypothetical protein WCK34_11950, partial [Bacteroidota bacterium]